MSLDATEKALECSRCTKTKNCLIMFRLTLRVTWLPRVRILQQEKKYMFKRKMWQSIYYNIH